jgi:hypothetical protein
MALVSTNTANIQVARDFELVNQLSVRSANRIFSREIESYINGIFIENLSSINTEHHAEKADVTTEANLLSEFIKKKILNLFNYAQMNYEFTESGEQLEQFVETKRDEVLRTVQEIAGDYKIAKHHYVQHVNAPLVRSLREVVAESLKPMALQKIKSNKANIDSVNSKLGSKEFVRSTAKNVKNCVDEMIEKKMTTVEQSRILDIHEYEQHISPKRGYYSWESEKPQKHREVIVHENSMSYIRRENPVNAYNCKVRDYRKKKNVEFGTELDIAIHGLSKKKVKILKNIRLTITVCLNENLFVYLSN